MKKTEKIVLPLLLCACLAGTGTTWAEDRIVINSEDTTYVGTSITGIFSNLSDQNAAEGEEEGGAIHNEGTITSITGTGEIEIQITKNENDGTVTVTVVSPSSTSFTNNKTTGGMKDGEPDPDTNVTGGKGGAIFNEGNIVMIDGVYFGENESRRGGAIYNGAVEIETDTYAEGTGTIGTIKGSYFVQNKGDLYAGAIYNSHCGVINSIDGCYFLYNESDAGNGGAVENAWEDSTIVSITGCYFEGNESSATQVGNNYYGGSGGALYNEGTIGSTDNTTGGISDSQFIDNEASLGGAIYNESTGTITSITGTKYTLDANGVLTDSSSVFSGNHSNGSKTTANGGAIDNQGTIGSITYTIFDSNEASSESSNYGEGGAIYNIGTINEISYCTFKGNMAASPQGEDVYGGAIQNGTYETSDGTMTIKLIKNTTFDSNKATCVGEGTYCNGGAISNVATGVIESITNCTFINNCAISEKTVYVFGGAIYSETDLTIAADNGYTIFSGNYTQAYVDGETVTDDNAIYMGTSYEETTEAVLTFKLSNQGTIILEDNIRGDDGYSVVISGDSTDTTFYLLNDIYDGGVSIGNTTLSTIDGEVHSYNDVYADDDGKITGDFYRMKSFSLTDNINMVVDVDLANEKMDRISTDTYSVGNYTLTVTGMNLISDTEKDSVAIYFAEPGLKNNVASSVGTVPGSEQQSAYTPMYEYRVTYDTNGTQYGDDGGYFIFTKSGLNPSVMAPGIAEAGAYNAFGMVFDYNFEHSDYYMKLPEDVRLAMSEERKNAKNAPKENDPTRSAYYNQHELTYHGAWTRSFFSNESVDYGGWSSRDKYYGAMVGFDTDMHVDENGWATVFTGYAGTLGIRQQYSGGHIKQHGGFIGATASFYKKNFYNAWTIAAGTMKAHEHTMYGKDKDRIDQYGIATRLGWNIKLDDEGKYTLLPTFTASYTYVHPEDFTNAGGVHIAGSGFRAVQLNPNVKFIMNLENGWQPYLTVGEVWTVAESTHLRANGTKLDELDFDPYTEYGIGVQKRWANEKDAYIQFLGHSHGRDGFLVNAGIRWNF